MLMMLIQKCHCVPNTEPSETLQDSLFSSIILLYILRRLDKINKIPMLIENYSK